ncbi:uncharacterized protein LOC130051533 [Ostrea edulis]|uniref:uncharacterized protein LOC130051533 n=1 Tax=Ostrea edulis TaxID=37623 RepID=UPI0024AF46BC|nr:uncharacterized protein LOC130051533 [Ostrea edulis]
MADELHIYEDISDYKYCVSEKINNKIRPPLYGQFASLYDSVPANDYLNYPKPLPREFEKCKDLIEKYVDAREVIPFMKANIEEDDINRIINKSNYSTSDGTKEFLKCLQKYSSSHAPFIWRSFELALKEADYDFVWKRIKGEIDGLQEECHEERKKRIQINRGLIYQHVDASDICPDLVSYKVISHARYEIIKSEEQQRGKCNATSPLIDSIWRLHVNWFEIFLRVLRNHNHGFIADEINKATGKSVKFNDTGHYHNTKMYDIPTTKSKVYGEYQPCCPCPVRYFRFENNGIEQRNIEKREENVSSNYDSITYTRQVDGYTIYTPPSYMYLPYSE